ncbi:MAG: dTMP kinase [Acidobacteriota bacterium]
MDNSRAVVVKIDGIDGCGKTTLVDSLNSAYRVDLNVLATKEFCSDLDNYASTLSGGTLTVSEILDRVCKCPNCDLDDIERELLWAVASRRSNRIVISPRLKKFDLILVDRSYLGNLAYGPALDHRLALVFDFVTTPVEIADLILWIDTPVGVCEERLRQRARDVIELKGSEFFGEVRSRYEALASIASNVKRLDGTLSRGALTTAAMQIIDSTREENRGTTRK